jgi:hypothetical protein
VKCCYFIIEPAFSDPDTFCRITIGGERVRASIQIYPDEGMLYEVAAALIDPDLAAEIPSPYAEDWEFHLQMSVLPGREGQKVLRARIWHDYEEDGTPYRADIRLQLAPKEATELSQELTSWLKRKDYTLCWKN